MGIGSKILEANNQFWGGIIHKGLEGAKGVVFKDKKEKQPKPVPWKH